MPTWTTPTTNRSTSYVPTQTDFGALANNLKFLQYQGGRGQTAVFHTSTSAPNTATGVWTTLPVYAHADATWRTSTAMLAATTGGTGAFTIPTGMTGVWNFDYYVDWEAWTPGLVNTHWYGVELVQGGSTPTTMVLKWQHPYVNGPNPLINSGSWAFYCTSGDTVRLKARQDSGSNKRAIGWLHGRWMSGGSGTRPSFTKVSVPSVRSYVTAAIWNQIQGNLKFLHDPPWCWGRLSTPQSHTTSTWLEINFDAADVYDASGMHSPGVTPSRFYVPYGGVYLVNCAAAYDANIFFGGRRSMVVERWTDRGDGTYVQCGDTRYGSYRTGMAGMSPLSDLYGYNWSGTALVHCRANDYLKFYTYQDGGVSLTLAAAEAQVIYLGQLRNVAYGDTLESPPEAGYVS